MDARALKGKSVFIASNSKAGRNEKFSREQERQVKIETQKSEDHRKGGLKE